MVPGALEDCGVPYRVPYGERWGLDCFSMDGRVTFHVPCIPNGARKACMSPHRVSEPVSYGPGAVAGGRRARLGLWANTEQLRMRDNLTTALGLPHCFIWDKGIVGIGLAR